MEEHTSNKMLESDYRWNEDKCIKLIQKFRSKSILWDTKNPMFYKQLEKKRVWDDIGRELNTTGFNCKHKMTVLLSSFRREKAKLKNSVITGIPYKTSWFAFHHLAFLMKNNTGTNSSETVDDGDDIANELSESNEEISYFVCEDDSNHYTKREPVSDEDEELERDLGIDHIQTDSPVPVRQDTEPYTLQHITPGTSGQNIHRGQRIQRKNMRQVDSNKEEEIATFTKFIQAKMQKYSPETIYTVQKHICDILFKADQNHCVHSTNDDDLTLNTTKKRKLSETLNHQNTLN